MITATVLVILVILLTLAHFYLKSSLVMSFSTLFAALIATAAAFGYHELSANLFISHGFGLDWALAGCFVLAFVLVFAIFRTVCETLPGSGIDLGKTPKTVAAIACGLLTGLIIAGNLLVAMGLMPVQHTLAYNRFSADKPLNLNRPSVPLLNPDGVVTGLYTWLSRGSLASKQSFGVVQTDFLTRTHLNHYRIAENVPAIASSQSLVLPPANKRPVRIWEIPNTGELTVVRIGIIAKSISDGGANNAAGEIKFFPGQIRLICKPSGDADGLRGIGQAVLPSGFLIYRNPLAPLDGKEYVEKELTEIIDKDGALGIREGKLWVDAAFKIPAGQTPVAFQFKQNATVSLIGVNPVPTPTTSPEIEQGLDAKEGTEGTSPQAL